MDPHHPITKNKKSQRNTRGSHFVIKRTNTNKYQNSCKTAKAAKLQNSLQSALRMKRDV
jgi:hypothetical protein